VTSPNSSDVPAADGTPPNAAPQCGTDGLIAVPPAPEAAPEAIPETVPEIGGRRDGTDPTRFGDWEKGGRCIDF